MMDYSQCADKVCFSFSSKATCLKLPQGRQSECKWCEGSGCMMDYSTFHECFLHHAFCGWCKMLSTCMPGSVVGPWWVCLLETPSVPLAETNRQCNPLTVSTLPRHAQVSARTRHGVWTAVACRIHAAAACRRVGTTPAAAGGARPARAATLCPPTSTTPRHAPRNACGARTGPARSTSTTRTSTKSSAAPPVHPHQHHHQHHPRLRSHQHRPRAARMSGLRTPRGRTPTSAQSSFGSYPCASGARHAAARLPATTECAPSTSPQSHTHTTSPKAACTFPCGRTRWRAGTRVRGSSHGPLPRTGPSTKRISNPRTAFMPRPPPPANLKSIKLLDGPVTPRCTVLTAGLGLHHQPTRQRSPQVRRQCQATPLCQKSRRMCPSAGSALMASAAVTSHCRIWCSARGIRMVFAPRLATLTVAIPPPLHLPYHHHHHQQQK